MLHADRLRSRSRDITFVIVGEGPLRGELEEKRRDMGPYTFGAQMMQDPKADETQGFKQDWIKFHEGSDGTGLNIYILVDPANDKKKTSDYTVMEVIGLGNCCADIVGRLASGCPEPDSHAGVLPRFPETAKIAIGT